MTDLPPRALRRDRLVVGCVLLVVGRAVIVPLLAGAVIHSEPPLIRVIAVSAPRA